MARRSAAINVPMTIRDGTRLCPGAYHFAQQPETILRFHVAEICTVRSKLRNNGISDDVTPWPITVIPSLGIGGGSEATAVLKCSAYFVAAARKSSN